MRIRENSAGIRCILFDLGQTVVAYHSLLVGRRFHTLSGVGDPKDKKYTEVRRRIVGKRGNRPNHRSPVYRASAGRTDTTTFIKEIRTVLNIDSWIPDSRVETCLRNSQDLSGRMRRLLYFLGDEEQDGRFILGIISNIPQIHADDLLATHPVLRLRKTDYRTDGDESGVMDVHIFSYAEKLMKPNRKIFMRGFRRSRKIARIHGVELKPRHCAYFDDLEENVAAARAIGMRAFFVTGSCDEEWGSNDSYGSIAGHLETCGISLPFPDYCPYRDKEHLSILKLPLG